MREAGRLMAKVFAVVFGAGAAIVVLGYLVLGGLHIYNRIETPKPVDYGALATKYGGTLTGIELYDSNSLPDVLPEAQLDCAKLPNPG